MRLTQTPGMPCRCRVPAAFVLAWLLPFWAAAMPENGMAVPDTATAEMVFDFNPRCQEAYAQIMMLKLEEGRRLLAEERREHPGNLIPDFLDNYVDLFTLFFHEDRTEYKAALAHRDQRLDRLARGPKDSPFYLYTRAMIHAQWGVVKLKFEDNLSAFWDVRRAYSGIRENQKKFPQFSPNKLLLGPMQALIGTIPSGYRWITSILGFSGGSVVQGMHLLESYVRDSSAEGRLFHEEAVFYYAYMKFYIGHEPDKVMAFLRDEHLDLVNNHLFAFMVANLALNNHMTDYGLQVATAMRKGPGYLDMPIMNYEIGIMRLYHLDLDEAIRHLSDFTEQFKGKFYVKDALFQLSRAYYLKGDMAQAQRYRRLVREKGSAVADADKAAQRDAAKGHWQDKNILKARMLMNGGYFTEALSVLKARDVSAFHDLLDKIEYAYFMGRIYDEMGDDDKALALYDATIRAGAERPEYYAARAAMQAGFIYEERKDTARALGYYRRCLAMKEEEYKTTLDQRAKAAINRLTVK